MVPGGGRGSGSGGEGWRDQFKRSLVYKLLNQNGLHHTKVVLT